LLLFDFTGLYVRAVMTQSREFGQLLHVSNRYAFRYSSRLSCLQSRKINLV